MRYIGHVTTELYFTFRHLNHKMMSIKILINVKGQANKQMR